MAHISLVLHSTLMQKEICDAIAEANDGARVEHATAAAPRYTLVHFSDKLVVDRQTIESVTKNYARTPVNILTLLGRNIGDAYLITRTTDKLVFSADLPDDAPDDWKRYRGTGVCLADIPANERAAKERRRRFKAYADRLSGRQAT